MKSIRHGDLMIEGLSEGRLFTTNPGQHKVTLAHGENGHRHVLESEGLINIVTADDTLPDGAITNFTLESLGILSHVDVNGQPSGEHGRHELSAGSYAVNRERIFNSFDPDRRVQGD